jgi:hypothetical protein
MLPLMVLALAVILLDQASKRWIHRFPEREFALGSLVRVHCVVNRNRIYGHAGTRIAMVALWSPGTGFYERRIVMICGA